MIVQEKVNKDGENIMRRCNELGLALDDFKILDWSPMFAILIFEDNEMYKSLKSKEAAQRKAEGQAGKSKG